MATKILLRTPAALCPLLLNSSSTTTPWRAFYHSYELAAHPPYPPAESAILSSALTHVPNHGFTTDSLYLGLQSSGYPPISSNLFPRGAFSLVQYYLVTQRLSLKDRIHIPTDIPVGKKVRALVLERLRANFDTGVLPYWQQALGLMSLAENIPVSVKELAALADEIWFLAGDVRVDSSWYTKRGTLSGVYAATELFQTTDQSTNFRDTEEFLDRRLEEVKTMGSAVGGLGEWMSFQGGAIVNLLRSKGVRV